MSTSRSSPSRSTSASDALGDGDLCCIRRNGGPERHARHTGSVAGVGERPDDAGGALVLAATKIEAIDGCLIGRSAEHLSRSIVSDVGEQCAERDQCAGSIGLSHTDDLLAEGSPLQRRFGTEDENQVALRCRHRPEADGWPHDVSGSGLRQTHVRTDRCEIGERFRIDLRERKWHSSSRRDFHGSARRVSASFQP